MIYSDLRKGRVSQSGLLYHITMVTQNRTACFSSFGKGSKVVQQLMALQAEGSAETLALVEVA